MGERHLLMAGPWVQHAAFTGMRWCRAGQAANAIRAAVGVLRRQAIPMEAWAVAQSLAVAGGVTAAFVAQAAADALRTSRRDWATECVMFGRLFERNTAVVEDWHSCAWEDPWRPDADQRSHILDAAGDERLWGLEGGAMFGDGGFALACGGLFSAQARVFGQLDQYWDDSTPAAAAVACRTPARYGFESVTVHCAEMAALVAALRWRQRGAWNMFVGDRSAFFAALEHGTFGSVAELHSAAPRPL